MRSSVRYPRVDPGPEGLERDGLGAVLIGCSRWIFEGHPEPVGPLSRRIPGLQMH
jgi:hypothetical protein